MVMKMTIYRTQYRKLSVFVTIMIIFTLITQINTVNGTINRESVFINLFGDETWQDQIIDLGQESTLYLNGNLAIINCTIIGGMKVKGRGGIDVLNSSWSLNTSDSYKRLLLLDHCEEINVSISKTELISNVSNMLTLCNNSKLILEETTISDLSGKGGTIHVPPIYEGKVDIEIINSRVNGGILISDGMKKSTLTIENSTIIYHDRTEPIAIVVHNMSSITIKGSKFDMNTKGFVGSDNTENIYVLGNNFYLNESRYGYTNTSLSNWKLFQRTLSFGETEKGLRIVNNTFSNLVKAVFSYNLDTTLTVIEDNIINDCYRYPIDIYFGDINIVNNTINRCPHQIYLHNPRNYLVVNNTFNNSEVDGSRNLYVDNGQNGTITNNLFIGGEKLDLPIEVQRMNNLVIKENIFKEGNDFGTIIIGKLRESMEVYNNTFYDTDLYLNDVTNSKVYLNQFYGKSSGYQVNCTTLQWDNGTFGNYWEGFQIFDDNGDLIGEVPYQGSITTYNDTGYEGAIDNFPLSIKFFKPGYNETQTTMTTDISSMTRSQTIETTDLSALGSTSSEKSTTEEASVTSMSIIILLITISCIAGRRKIRK